MIISPIGQPGSDAALGRAQAALQAAIDRMPAACAAYTMAEVTEYTHAVEEVDHLLRNVLLFALL